MQNLLTQFALRDVWCDPYQDKQTVIRLARITKKGGGFKTAPVIRLILAIFRIVPPTIYTR